MEEIEAGRSGISRRALGQMLAGGAIGAAGLGAAGSLPAYAASAKSSPEPGIKIGLAWNRNPTDDDLLFLRNLGVEYVITSLPLDLHAPKIEERYNGTGDVKIVLPTLDDLLAIKARFAKGGIKVHTIRSPFHFVPKEIVCNMPGRDEKLEGFLGMVRLLGKAGFYYMSTCYFETGLWRNGPAETRGATSSEFDADAPVFQQGYKINEPAYGRNYTRDEILKNYEYFVKKLKPVAEDAGVNVGFHPDDVPVYETMGGVPRLFNNFREIKARLETANSPNIGFLMCCGTWDEGGDKMGATVEEAVRYFCGQNKAWEVHFRNISAPLPKFKETFLDNGYVDMYRIMKTANDVGYREFMYYDHMPGMPGNPYSYSAYTIGYMKALYQRAQAGSSVGHLNLERG